MDLAELTANKQTTELRSVQDREKAPSGCSTQTRTYLHVYCRFEMSFLFSQFEEMGSGWSVKESWCRPDTQRKLKAAAGRVRKETSRGKRTPVSWTRIKKGRHRDYFWTKVNSDLVISAMQCSVGQSSKNHCHYTTNLPPPPLPLAPAYKNSPPTPQWVGPGEPANE